MTECLIIPLDPGAVRFAALLKDDRADIVLYGEAVGEGAG
ncbi:hypothetical protein LDFHOB_12370 [Candidatus Electronema aureum]